MSKEKKIFILENIKLASMGPDTIVYIPRALIKHIKIKKKQLIFDVGVGLGILGITFLVFYGLSKLRKE